MTTRKEKAPIPLRSGFDPEMAGKLAECDGGGPVGDGQYAARQEFTGRLTGEYVDHGDPPWRWYLMIDLRKKPEGYAAESVWCESQSLFLIDETAR